MKKYTVIRRLFAASAALFFACSLQAQQLPDPSFEDWSGAKFDGNIQPKHWHFSNVEQLGIKFTLSHQEKGHTGNYSMMVQCTEVGAMGITEAAPGYISLGQPWQCLPSITEIKKATAGTSGGIEWKYRPDSVQVWVKRTGNNTDKEDFHILYYAWNGTAKGSSYKGKDNSCTSYNATDEESDIRQALDKNECTTTQFANQVAEAWHRARAKYDDWTCLTIPVYYFNDEAPTKCNVIFSASNYPNFRANGGLYVGNSLYVDDIKMVYSSKIQKLYVGGKEWKGFDPNSTDEQIYSLGNNPTIPEIYAMRGAGTLTNAHGGSATFNGRKLSGSEIAIQKGAIDGAPTVITVKAEDGSSTTTYKIKFVSKPSDNARLAGIQVNGENLSGFNSYVANYNVALPYGTTAAPKVTFTQAEDGQTVVCTQATSTSGKATIQVTAADGKTTFTYTLNFSVALLADNTLKDILIDGTSLPGFKPEYTTYNRVELPLGTTTVPKIEAVSAYPAGAQTIKHTAPSVIDGGQYQIAVSTPGNPTPKVYKLNFKITASTNTLLKNLQVGSYITNFDPELTTYYVTLPMGTTALPEITYEQGDKWQTVTVESEGIDGTSRITVTAASGDQRVYKIVFNTLKSEVDWLENIYLDGVALEGFARDKYVYEYQLPIGTTVLPTITYDTGDEFQTVTMKTDGLNGTTRITVVAGNGSTAVYQIKFSVLKANNANLKMIYVDGTPLADFSATKLEYTLNLPQGTTEVPAITWDKGDEWQTVTYRKATSLTGESKITVRPQDGSSQTYVIRFTVNTSANTDLKMIYLDGDSLVGFHKDTLNYEITLPVGVSTIPVITYEEAEKGAQRVMQLKEGTTYTLRVTAENGDTKSYKITFNLQKSDNAYLKMIYLDDKPLEGFVSDSLSGYVVSLSTDICPTITVDKEAGQQVTIIAPASTGEARIIVQPESGGMNEYIITFIKPISVELQLKNILVDSVPVADFAPDKYTYEVVFAGKMPLVTYEKISDTQEVTLLQNKDTIRLMVQDGTQNNFYTLHFRQTFSEDAALKSILLDDVLLADFKPTQLAYTVPVAADKKVPVVTYEKNDSTQSVVAGALSEFVYEIRVTAESGKVQTYTITFDKAQFTDATLVDLLLDGKQISGFHVDSTAYTVVLDKGMPLPTLTFVKRVGQTLLHAQTSDSQQQVIVVAGSGATRTYTVNYVFKESNNALLKDLLVGGKTITGFAPDKFEYTDSLAWRTTVVPIVNPIEGIAGQTITVRYSSLNGITLVHVVSPDGSTTADYKIAFPVAKSSNTMLEGVLCEQDFEFDPQVSDYEITMPYGKNYAPVLQYEKQEVEQSVNYLAAPMGDTTKIVVTAENGDQRTYRFFFHPTLPTAENRLQSILVNGVEVDTALWKVIDAEHVEVTVEMPYGTNTFNVACVTNYAEQTYFIQPGGTLRSTIITLKANRPNEKDVIYTIRPKIDTQNPAHLTHIIIDGDTLADFSPDRYSYILPLKDDNLPNFTCSFAQNATAETIVMNERFWQVTVKSGEYSQMYTVRFHYVNDTIPNADFTDWTKASTRTSADKPTSWQVAADYADTHLGTADTGAEVTNGGNGTVKMTTTYWAALASAIPSVMTLGQLNFSFAVDGGTVSKFYGGIPFRNTPDSVAFRYHHKTKKGNGMRFAFRFNDGAKEHAFDYVSESVTNNYVTHVHPLGTADLKKVIQMNIAVDATDQERGGTSGAEAYVDWFRYIYNSKLQSITIGDSEDLKFSAQNVLIHDLTNSEDTSLPVLKFAGEVSDQAQRIIWDKENAIGAWGIRTAQVRNFAEDGTFTDYEVRVRRPLSKVNTLKSIELNGIQIENFHADTLRYVYSLDADEKIPNISVTPATNLQIVSMQMTNNTMIITVKPEHQDTKAKTYIIAFRRIQSSDTTLKSLTAEGLTFDPQTRQYTLTADRMPIFQFEKAHPAQTVDVQGGVITVTAEDGKTVGKYEILLQPTLVATSALFTGLQLDGNDIQGFESTNFTYEYAKPRTTAFVRAFATDSVVQLISSDSITWTVYGTDTTHTYKVIYPTVAASDANLEAIFVNGERLAEFLPKQDDYQIVTDTAITLALQTTAGQQLDVTYLESTFTINVTAADGTKRPNPYTLQILPELSDVATLKMIYIDGKPLQNYYPDLLQYTVTLPSDNPKMREPQMPSVTYDLGHESQTVRWEIAPFGEPSLLIVKSERGDTEKMYELNIQPEPSHNAQLNNILVNGVQVQGFLPDRYWYSAQVTGENVSVEYSSDDMYQKVVKTRGSKGEEVIEVTAQDGVTKLAYHIELWQQKPSNNAYLKDVRLDDDKTFSQYDTTAQDFDAKQLYYNIRIPETATQLPDLYVALQEEGQNWKRLSGNDVDTIRVTAPDGITTNDYVLNFLRVKSSNANLGMIYLDSQPMEIFDPEQTTYTINLPVGTASLPVIDVITAEPMQTYTKKQSGNTVFYTVTAEDGTQKLYTLNFIFLLSEADTLTMLYEDGEQMHEFAPRTFYYAKTLPVGVRTFPELSYEAADQWQTVTIDTISATMQTTYQLNVTAQSGKKNVYTVVYTLQQSAVDTLKMIYLDNKELENFVAQQTDYLITLPTDATNLPAISWLEGDEYQKVDTITFAETTKLTVQAENGATRTYSITFTKELSSNATLKMISVAGTDLANFDGEVLTYDVSLPYGTSSMPAVTFTKAEEAQNVSLSIQGWTAQITVVAADGKTTQTYTINCTVNRSDNAYLQMIRLDGKAMTDFQAEQTEYDILLPLGTEKLPEISWLTADDQQTVQLDTITPTSLMLTVTSGNGEATTEYLLRFQLEKSPINTLSDLAVAGTTIKDFKPEVNEYYLTFEPYTSESDLYTIEDVTFALTDSTASATAFAQDAFTLMVLVTAENGASNAYIIHQEILLPNNALLDNIMIDSVTIEGFDPEIFEYDYLLLDGGIMPTITATALDTTAEVSVTMGNVGDTTYIYCTAQDGTEYIYTVYVHYTDIQTTAPATDQDVLLKHIPGSNQFFAATTRQGVQIMILDLNGRKMQLHKVPTCDPNSVSVTTDANGNELLTDVDVNSEGAIITIDDFNTPLFYLFLQNDTKVTTGKIMITR